MGKYVFKVTVDIDLDDTTSIKDENELKDIIDIAIDSAIDNVLCHNHTDIQGHNLFYEVDIEKTK